MITIYSATETDFSTLGLGALEPSECEIEEQAGGMYELTIHHPITDDLKSTLILQDRIIKVPAPIRETPRVEIGNSGTVTRHIYKVVTDGRRLTLRVAASSDAKAIHAYKPNTEVSVIATSGSWSNVIIVDGGATGWMWSSNLEWVRDETDVITGDSGTVIQSRQVREQLFRIYNVEVDNKQREVVAQAKHISYDLGGVLVADTYSPEDVSAATICTNILQKADHDAGFTIYCTVADAISIDCTGRNVLDIICNADDGILAQTGARLIRDNYDLFIIPAQTRNTGVELRYGKNLLSAYMITDSSNIITRIQPAGKTKDGEVLLISDTISQSYVDSSRISQYPTIRAKRIEYDVVESDDLPKADARQALIDKANADFTDGVDLPSITLDADFVRLELSEDYAELANSYALHLYDSVPVIDDEAGIVATAKMTGYKYDGILDRYSATTLGSLDDANVTVYGYEIASNSVSGSKIVPNTMDGNRIRDLTVSGAKITNAAIGTAKIEDAAINTAKIDDLAVTSAKIADAAIGTAKIADAAITNAKIGSAAIDTANIADAAITSAKIGSAAVGTANIASAAITTAKIENGAITTALIGTSAVGTTQIADASVTDAKIVGLTASKITAGTIDAATVNLNNLNADNITTGTINGQRIPTLGSDKIEDGAISGVKIVNGAVTTDKITDGAVTAAKIVASAVTADKIAASAVTTNALAASAVTAAKVDITDLFAASATISALDANLIKASNITALENSLDVWASDKINLNVAQNGVNLLTGTSLTTNISGFGVWTQSSGSTATTYSHDETGKGKPYTWIRVDESAATSGCILRANVTSVTVTAGTTYTFSVDTNGFNQNFRIGAVYSDNTETWTSYTSVGSDTRISHTFTPTTTSITLCIDRTSGSTCYDIRKWKLEVGSTATPWMAESEVYNSSITIDTNGIAMTGGTIDMQAGTAFKVKSGGTVQIDASSADNSYINLGDGNFTASKQGGVRAEMASFSSLTVGGERALTVADLPLPIVFRSTKPLELDNILWVEPTGGGSVTTKEYTAYTASSRSAAVDFYRTNPITRSFSPSSTDTLSGSVVYSIDVPLHSHATVTSFSLYAQLTCNGQTCTTNTVTVSLAPSDIKTVTLTVTSSAFSGTTIPISVSFYATFSGGSGNVYMESNTTLTLTASQTSTASDQVCAVHYIPYSATRSGLYVSSGTLLSTIGGRTYESMCAGWVMNVIFDNAWLVPVLVTTSNVQAISAGGGTWIDSSSTSFTHNGNTWYMTNGQYAMGYTSAFSSNFPILNNITGNSYAYSDLASAGYDIITYCYKET